MGACCKGGKGKKLCPVSFGLALGITSALAVLIGTSWVIYMYDGMSTMMADLHMSKLTWQDSGIFTGIALIKGFLFGFFVALFYDLISCCCRSSKCCANCSCANCTNKECSCNCHK